MSSKKRRHDGEVRERAPRPKKRVRKQKEYHSSSEDSEGSDSGFAPVKLNDSEEDEARIPKSNSKSRRSNRLQTAAISTGANSARLGSDSDSGDHDTSDEISGDNLDSTNTGFEKRRKAKRNDPEAFSNSISKILSTKLSQSARKDPVLSRSRAAVETSSGIANEKLERKAKAKLRTEKKEALERGRVKDVLGLTTGDAGETAEEERKLRKIAQRGVVKLFNAVRAAQVRGEQAAREERRAGTVGMTNRQEKATEMSKQGFLDLINGQNKSKVTEA